MFKKWLLLMAVVFFCQQGFAQYTKYIVRLTDKGSTPFSINNPSAFLSPRAIERRTRYSIPIDSADLPVTPRYIDSIRLAGNVTILNVSKWLNQVAIQTSDALALSKISGFPFVANINPIAARQAVVPVNKTPETIISDPVPVFPHERLEGYYNYGRSNGQVKIHQGDFLHNHGFRGNSMQVAVLDGGFFNYQTLPTFDSARNNNQILGTWDFVANEASVNEDNSHGMHCLSTMAANMPGTFVGTSPGASFYLFRTEDVATEYPIEEQNWAAGAEKADSLGVDVCSVSLGYTEFDDPAFNHTYTDMNGQTTIVARASNMAARKGMLVVVAAGNEGNGSWHYISSPGDADSVLTVGAVDTLGRVASFSGYGPSSDGQIKPDVAAVGWLAIVANGNTGQPSYSNGTSFACPNMAGIATCLWQAFPEVNNMEIRQTLRESSTRYSNPDDRIGYGIPDAKKAFVLLQKKTHHHEATKTGCALDISLSIKTDNSTVIDLERKTSADTGYQVVRQFQHDSPYGMHTFNYAEDLGQLSGSEVSYRMIVRIASDTSYLLDSIVQSIPACTALADDIRINPNPFSGTMTVQTRSTSTVDVTILVHNSVGQLVNKTGFSQAAGTRTTSIPVQSLAKGVYFVTGYFNGQKIKTIKAVNR